MTKKIHEFIDAHLETHWKGHPKPTAISLLHVSNILYEFNKIESLVIIQDLLDNIGVVSDGRQMDQKEAISAATEYLNTHK